MTVRQISEAGSDVKQNNQWSPDNKTVEPQISALFELWR